MPPRPRPSPGGSSSTASTGRRPTSPSPTPSRAPRPWRCACPATPRLRFLCSSPFPTTTALRQLPSVEASCDAGHLVVLDEAVQGPLQLHVGQRDASPPGLGALGGDRPTALSGHIVGHR